MERDIDDVSKSDVSLPRYVDLLTPFASIELNREVQRLIQEKTILVSENRQLKEERDFFYSLLMKKAQNPKAEQNKLKLELQKHLNSEITIPLPEFHDIGIDALSYTNTLSFLNSEIISILPVEHKQEPKEIPNVLSIQKVNSFESKPEEKIERNIILRIRKCSNFSVPLEDKSMKINTFNIYNSNIIHTHNYSDKFTQFEPAKKDKGIDNNGQTNDHADIATSNVTDFEHSSTQTEILPKYSTAESQSELHFVNEASTQSQNESSLSSFLNTSKQIQYKTQKVQATNADRCDFSKKEFLSLLSTFENTTFKHAEEMLSLAQSGDAIVSYFTKLCGSRIQSLEFENSDLICEICRIRQESSGAIAKTIIKLKKTSINELELKDVVSRCLYNN